MTVAPDGHLFVTNWDGIRRSTDGGSSWTQHSVNGYGADQVAIDDSGTIYAVNTFVYHSTDEGDHWQIDSSGLSGGVETILIANSGWLFAGGDGVFRSTNRGKTWVKANGDFWSGLSSGQVVRAFASDSSGGILAATYNTLYRTIDSGSTWVTCNHTFLGITGLATSRDGRVVVSTLQEGLLSSTNGDSSWSQMSVGLDSIYVQAVAVTSRGQIFAASLYEGVYRWENLHGQWEKTPFPGSVVGALAEFPNGRVFAGTVTNGVWETTDHGATWLDRHLPSLGVQALACSPRGLLFAAHDIGGVFRFSLGSQDWTVVNNGLANAQPNSIVSDANGTSYVGGAGGVYRSTDDGMTWTMQNQYSFHALSLSDSGSIYAVRDPGGVAHSSNLGVSWSPLNSGLQEEYVWTLLVGNSGNLYAGTWTGVFRLMSGSSTWERVLTTSTLVPGIACNRLGDVFAGTFTGRFYRYSSQHEAWSEFGQPFPGAEVLALDVDAEGFLVVGTNGSGVIRTNVSTTGVADAPVLPTAVYLFQNYPNPFNPSTTIRYALPRRSHVTLTVFNTLGQKVAELINADIDAGQHEQKFDGSRMASGVYFYRLQAGGFVQTRKLCLIQ